MYRKFRKTKEYQDIERGLKQAWWGFILMGLLFLVSSGTLIFLLAWWLTPGVSTGQPALDQPFAQYCVSLSIPHDVGVHRDLGDFRSLPRNLRISGA